MTPVLPRIDSGSTVGEEGYEENEAVTRLLHLADQMGPEGNFQSAQRAGVYDGALTAMEVTEVDLLIGEPGLGLLVEGKAGSLGVEPERLVVATDVVAETEFTVASGVYFVFAVKGVTSPSDVFEDFLQELGSVGVEAEVPAMLGDALAALYQLSAVAREEDCDPPTDVALGNAEFVLREMFGLSPRTYDIYPMSGGEVVIDAGNRGRRIGVFCYPEGEVQYVVVLEDERRDVRKVGVQDIPVDLLRRALSQLDF